MIQHFHLTGLSSTNIKAELNFTLGDLKKWLGGQRFANNEKKKSVVNGYFEELDGSHYKQYTIAIEQSWEKCIELK